MEGGGEGLRERKKGEASVRPISTCWCVYNTTVLYTSWICWVWINENGLDILDLGYVSLVWISLDNLLTSLV